MHLCVYKVDGGAADVSACYASAYTGRMNRLGGVLVDSPACVPSGYRAFALLLRTLIKTSMHTATWMDFHHRIALSRGIQTWNGHQCTPTALDFPLSLIPSVVPGLSQSASLLLLLLLERPRMMPCLTPTRQTPLLSPLGTDMSARTLPAPALRAGVNSPRLSKKRAIYSNKQQSSPSFTGSTRLEALGSLATLSFTTQTCGKCSLRSCKTIRTWTWS